MTITTYTSTSIWVFLCVLHAAFSAHSGGAAGATAGHRRAVTFYGSLQSPSEHPLARRRAVSPPEYSAFGPSGIGWMALRGFATNTSGALQDIDELLDQYTTGPDAVSSVLWPNVGTAAAPNFGELVGKLNQRNLGLMMGGFVPGGRNQFDTSRLPHFGAVQSLGPRYLGLGQSEQDGRYLAYLEEGKYDVTGTTTSDDGRFNAYTAFRRYSSAIERLSGGKLYVLDRGVFAHYYLPTGLYTVAGAELSGSTNAQLTYAFVRGAAKQYGTLLLSNVCSFTRWGHKIPADPSPTPSCERGSDHGDTCGTSYSSMKRLLYTLMSYDTATAGFEVYYYSPVNKSLLTPIGRIQARAKTFAEAHPLSERGVHIASTAILLDYFAGWEAPCAATDNGWPFTSGFGQTAYSAPDFLADGIFDLVWPGYRNAGFFHDASFELTPTPWGDVFDVLLSDVSADLLSRYDTVIVGHALQSNSLTVADRLEQFVTGGGQLTVMFDSLADLGSAGEKLVGNASRTGHGLHGSCTLYDSVRVTFVDGSTVQEPHPQRICVLQPPSGARVLATAVVVAGSVGGDVKTAAVPVAFRTQPNERGGSVTVIGVGNYGVTPTALPVGSPCQIDTPTASPQPLARTVARLLSDTMADQGLFDIGGPNTSLSWVPKRVTDTEFIIGVGNTQLQQQPLDIKATFGSVTSTTEILLDDSEKREAGYLPHGFQGHDIGQSTNTTIAGADFRMFRVTVQPDASVPAGGINALPHAVMPTAPTGIWLRLSPGVDLQHSLQRRVTFKQTFDGVLIDWSYLSVRTEQAVQADAHWLHSQRLSAGVDLSSAINLFPGVRLGNFTSDPTRCHGNGLCADGEFFEQSLATIRDILSKCSAMNINHTASVCRDVFFTLHGMPELGPEPSLVKQQVAATIKLLRAEAAAFAEPLTLHLRHGRKNADIAGVTAQEQHAWAASVGVQFSPNTGLVALAGETLSNLLSPGNFLLVDGVSNLYSTRRVGTERPPLLGTEPQLLQVIGASVHAALAANVSVVLDANYASLSDEEADSIWLGRLRQAQPLPPIPPPTPPPPGSRCYKLGTPVRGICTVLGNTARHQKIVMGCPASPGSHCYADYMFPNGTWARDYENDFSDALTAANVANATTQLTEENGQWTVTVNVSAYSEAIAIREAKGAASASWQSATGYLQRGDVTSIVCGVPHAPTSQVAFACVCGYSCLTHN